tara:strand:- start:35 stop:211 length:177 start_codon:yes stop_codon:yes gene_type:complete
VEKVRTSRWDGFREKGKVEHFISEPLSHWFRKFNIRLKAMPAKQLKMNFALPVRRQFV